MQLNVHLIHDSKLEVATAVGIVFICILHVRECVKPLIHWVALVTDTCKCSVAVHM